jgi:flagellar biosynthesis protein FliR
MNAAVFAGVEQQVLLWFAAMLRPGAALAAAPLFGAASVPLQLRIALAFAIGSFVAGSMPVSVLPDVRAATAVGFVAVELMAGVALGFALRLGVAAAEVAGEAIGNAMGLGFAAMQDPLSGSSSPALAQAMAMTGTLLLVVSNGHLALIDLIVRSYLAVPVGGAVGPNLFATILGFGSVMFALAVQIALPVASAVLAGQIVTAFAARSAPALNLFAVGMPATMLAGLIALALAWPTMTVAIEGALESALALAAGLA